METGCDAALPLRSPRRFQIVCPLLKPDATGQLRCSANTADVRPFWGRAALIAAGALLALYLAGATSFFAVQRALGKPMSYRQAVWPPAWKEYPRVQSLFFAAKARQALADKNIPEAMISLSLAYQLDPDNYTAGMTLASLWQFSQPAMADRVFAKLAHDHPTQRGTTLAAWYQSLLLRGDFGAILSLAPGALKEDPAHADAWLHAILFALRRVNDTATVASLASDASLPADARELFALEQRTRQTPAEQARAELQLGPAGTAYPYFDYYRTRRLLELGFASDAISLAGRPGIRLTDRDKAALWLDAQAALGWTAQTRTEVGKLLGNAFNPAAIDLLCAHLIRHPDQPLLDLAAANARLARSDGTDQPFRATIAILCAAGAGRDLGTLHDATARAKALAGGRHQILDGVETFFRSGGSDGRIEAFLPALQPVATEVIYALLERYYRGQSRPGSERQPAHTP